MNHLDVRRLLSIQTRRREFLFGAGVLAAMSLTQHRRGRAMSNLELAWRAPEDLVEIGFKRSCVVMMNEAHSGQQRNVRSREVGRRILPTAHAAGVRHLAMEALTPLVTTEANSTRQLPERPENAADYLTQPEMRALIQEALDLGWTLIPYEINFEEYPSTDTLSLEYTNLREKVQAENLVCALRELPSDAKLLVWCGNSHHFKTIATFGDGELTFMGYHFVHLSGIEHFVIEQTLSINWSDDSTEERRFAPFMPDLVELGGTAGFLVEEAPPNLALDKQVMDAVVLSTQNDLE